MLVLAVFISHHFIDKIPEFHVLNHGVCFFYHQNRNAKLFLLHPSLTLTSSDVSLPVNSLTH